MSQLGMETVEPNPVHRARLLALAGLSGLEKWPGELTQLGKQGMILWGRCRLGWKGPPSVEPSQFKWRRRGLTVLGLRLGSCLGCL